MASRNNINVHPQAALPEKRERVPDAEPVVTAKDFSLFYGEHEAVKKVSVSMPAMQVTAIIGPSGCGKSTFLRSINRMNDLIPGTGSSGQLMINGQDVYAKRIDIVALRKKVGMVFQEPNPFPKSIFDNIS